MMREDGAFSIIVTYLRLAAQGENIVLDDEQRVWGAWQATRAWQSSPGVDSYRLYRYDPKLDQIEYLNKGLPLPNGRCGYAFYVLSH